MAATTRARMVKGLSEAELVLDVALRLEKLLLRQPGVEVMLTRRTNVYVAARGAHRDGQPRGRRPVPLDSRQRQRRRPRPRRRDLLPQLRARRGGRGDRRPRERRVRAHHAPAARHRHARSRSTTRSTSRATSLAWCRSRCSRRLRKSDKRARNLGVKQAPFMVLIGATMPSILAEISFLTNRQDAGAADHRQVSPADRRGAARRRHALPAVTEEGPRGGSSIKTRRSRG